ncbi:MAG: phycobiliprotein lyase, partial [Gloeomargarita sp. DG02_1_bins_92]
SGLGMVFTWSENNRPVAVTTLTFDPDAQQFRQDNGTGASRTGYYTWNPAGVMELTLALASGQSVTERLWFASANLRLRTVLVRRDQGLESVAFYSDIRRVAAP